MNWPCTRIGPQWPLTRTEGLSPRMRMLLRWWTYPTDYDWTVAYHRGSPFLCRTNVALGSWCWLYSILCVLATHSPAAVPDGFGRLLAYTFAIAGAVTGAIWMFGPWPSKVATQIFLSYLEVSGAALLLLLQDPFVALPFVAALAVTGSYLACFHSPKMFLAHQVWTISVTIVLFIRAVNSPGSDVVLACAYLTLLILVLIMAPILTHALLLLLRQDAATAFFDPLTGLRNRRGLDAALAERDDWTQTGTVMVIDLDDFKKLNDKFGHNHGDLVLRDTANAIYGAFVPPAITARTGGEEFVVVTDADPTEAIEQAYRLRDQFRNHAGAATTISIGIAHLAARTWASEFQNTWERADAAMYTAKQTGGDAVFVDTQTIAT